MFSGPRTYVQALTDICSLKHAAMCQKNGGEHHNVKNKDFFGGERCDVSYFQNRYKKKASTCEGEGK